MKIYFRQTILFLLCVFFVGFSVQAKAEFVQTHLNSAGEVYQNTADLTLKVVVTTGDVSGIFVIRTKEEIPPQLFDASQIQSDQASTLFVEFKEKYSAVYYAGERKTIAGDFTIIMDPLSKKKTSGVVAVSIDNKNPYLTIRAEKEGKKGTEPTILGFHGVTPVLSGRGEALIALAEANQLRERSDVIFDYHLRGSDLYLRNRNIAKLKTIGIELKNELVRRKKNICLQDRKTPPVYLLKEDMKKLKQEGDSAKRVTKVEQLIREDLRSKTLRNLLLRVTDEMLVFLDPLDRRLLLVEPVETKNLSRQILCSVTEMPL